MKRVVREFWRGWRGARIGREKRSHTILLRRMQVCRIRLVQLLIRQWSKGSIRRIYMFCVRCWQIERQRTKLTYTVLLFFLKNKKLERKKIAV